MARIYIIAAEYGQWDCYRQDDLFATMDEEQARRKLVELADQFAGVFSQMVENYAHMGDFGDLSGDENVIAVAKWSYHDDGLTLAVRSMEVGCTTRGFEYMERREIPFMPKDSVSLNDIEPYNYDSKYERMAFPYEQLFFGVRH